MDFVALTRLDGEDGGTRSKNGAEFILNNGRRSDKMRIEEVNQQQLDGGKLFIYSVFTWMYLVKQ